MSIQDNINKIIEKIQDQKQKLGITYPITIVGVTKTLPSDTIKKAVEYGITNIGENRVQEAENKFKDLENFVFKKHLIGHLQENKAGKAALLFDMIQSIDSIDICYKINKKASETGKIIPVLIEINTSGEISKFGIKPEETEDLIGKIKEFKSLSINGFMTVGPLTFIKEDIRKSFKLLIKLSEKMKRSYPELNLETISMGMSDDFEIAVEEGSNMLRLGRILFGERTSQL